MYKTFNTTLKNVKKNGTLIENAQIVYSLNENTDGIEIPTKYLGCALLGLMYDPTTQEFYQVEEVKEKSQLDRIEEGTAKLLSDIQSQAIDEYTMELLNMGVL